MNKNKILFLTSLIGVGAITQADFVGIVDTKVAKINKIDGKQSEYTEWLNKGTHYNCLNWSPNESTVDIGTAFTQLRNCSQNQERTETVYDIWSNGNKVVSEINIQEQILTEQESQSATGTKNYTTTERIDPWGSWHDVTINYDCLSWIPEASTIDYGLEFSQSRNCSKDQERERNIYDVWADGSETLNRTETNSQTISSSEMQQATGTKNLIETERLGDWSEWLDINVHYNCSVWTPDSSSIDLGVDFTQTRDCLQDQERERNVYEVWADGSETLNRTENESQTITEQESQLETGTRNDKDSTRTESWSSWKNKGSSYDCTAWSPNINTVNHGTTFTQNANCSQDQERTRNIYDVWTNGSETLNRTELEEQTTNVSETQSAVGIKDYVIGTVTGSWSNWTDSGSHYDCGIYTPDTSTVDYGQSFTQTRDCKQNETRSRTIYDDWKIGSNTVNRVESDNQTINESETRSATGTKNYQSGTSYGSWSSWTDSGSHYNCGSYSPDVTTVNYGQSFTQTRSCKQNQSRTRTVYNDWADGSKTVKTTEAGNQTINESETRSATGTKNYITGTSYSSWSGWSDSGSHYNCGSWSPNTSTVDSGQSFTQTRSCKQNQSRTRTVYNDWADGSKIVKTTETGNQTINETESRSATGTKIVYGTWAKISSGSTPGCFQSDPKPTWACEVGESYTQYEDGHGDYGGCLVTNWECK